MVKLVNLSNEVENKLRAESKKENGARAYYSDEYIGLDFHERARKAALHVSDNGRCWWIYDWLFRELTWRKNETVRT